MVEQCSVGVEAGAVLRKVAHLCGRLLTEVARLQPELDRARVGDVVHRRPGDHHLRFVGCKQKLKKVSLKKIIISN